MKSVGRNAFYNLAGTLVPVVFSLVTVPLYLKLIGPERYGVLAIAWLLLGYFGLFDLGLGRATTYHIATRGKEGRDDVDAILNTALAINVVIGAIGALLLWGICYWFFGQKFKVDGEIRSEIMFGLPLLACAVPIATLTGVLTGAMQGKERFAETNTISTVSTILFQVLPLAIAWTYGPYLPHLLAAAILARVAAMVVLWIRRPRSIEKTGRWVDWAEAKSLVNYGGWLAITSLLIPFLVLTDRFLIGSLIGATAVAHYSLAYQLVQRYSGVPASLTNALFPRLAATQGEEAVALARRATKTLLELLAFPTCLALYVMLPFMTLWLGKEVGSIVSPIGQIFLIGYWANAFALVFFAKIHASGKPSLLFWRAIIQLPIYLPALAAGIYYGGLIGCAMVFTIRSILDYLIVSYASINRFLILPMMPVVLAALVVAVWSNMKLEFGSLQWAAIAVVTLGLTASISLKATVEFAKTRWKRPS